MRLALLAFLVAATASAQNSQTMANPQYQLTGKDYSREAPAIQQMLYNVASAVQVINTAAAATNAAIPTNVFVLNSTQTVSGATIFSSSVTLNGFTAANSVIVSSNDSHIEFSGPAPAATHCSGGTANVVGNDSVGRIQGYAASTTCYIQFRNAWSNPPFCIASSSITTFGVGMLSSSVSQATFTFTSSTAGVDYHCFGYR